MHHHPKTMARLISRASDSPRPDRQQAVPTQVAPLALSVAVQVLAVFAGVPNARADAQAESLAVAPLHWAVERRPGARSRRALYCAVTSLCPDGNQSAT